MSSLAPKEPELGLKGKGAERLSLPDVDKLIEKLIFEEEASDKQAMREGESYDKLFDAMHKHGDQLRQPGGALVYRYNGKLVTVVAGAEKLKIKPDKGAK